MGKKEEILFNVAKIIFEEGIQKLTIDYVAEKSNLTKGGVLYHFQSKENLLIQMNKMVISQYEQTIMSYEERLTGPYSFSRAYAKATKEMLAQTDDVLLPAVLICTHENEVCKKLWMDVTEKWGRQFENDFGDPQKILQLRLLCDGIWFSIMYNYGKQFARDMQQLLEMYCKELKSEA